MRFNQRDGLFVTVVITGSIRARHHARVSIIRTVRDACALGRIARGASRAAEAIVGPATVSAVRSLLTTAGNAPVAQQKRRPTLIDGVQSTPPTKGHRVGDNSTRALLAVERLRKIHAGNCDAAKRSEGRKCGEQHQSASGRKKGPGRAAETTRDELWSIGVFGFYSFQAPQTTYKRASNLKRGRLELACQEKIRNVKGLLILRQMQIRSIFIHKRESWTF